MDTALGVLFFGVRNMRTVTTETREATGSAVSGRLVEVVQSRRVDGNSTSWS